MAFKWIGALLIVCACAGFGFHLAAQHRKEERCLKELLLVIEYIICQIQYQKTPLPQLLSQASVSAGGILNRFFMSIAEELDQHTFSDVQICLQKTMTRFPEIPASTRELLLQMSKTLGKFDLNGQIAELENTRSETENRIKRLAQSRDVRLRSYQTLGLCAGAALAILFV